MTEVTVLVAVVVAVQPDQVLHWLAHGPLVHPLQVEAGQSDVPHQLVQGPSVHDPPELNGPHAPWPKGEPCPPHPGAPGAPVPQGPPELQALVAQPDGQAVPPEVAEKVASGLAVTSWPTLAQSWAMA